MEHIRRLAASRPGDETRVFFADRGECTPAVVDAWGADEVSVHHLRALLQLFRSPFSRPRGKVVFTVHGIHLRKYGFLPKTAANRLKRRLRLELERLLYRRCDRLVALTAADAAELARLYGRLPPVDVVPNRVDASEFKGPEAALRYGKGAFAFACIARFDFQKGQDVLARAIAIAQGALRAAGRRTLFIGDGPTRSEVERIAAESGAADLMEFAGEIPGAGAYMACAGTLVAPSRWEGMPYLLLEAAARGRRVIASDCPGNREALAACRDAALFPVEDSAALAAMLATGAEIGV